jgi:hypothetical protein
MDMKFSRKHKALSAAVAAALFMVGLRAVTNSLDTQWKAQINAKNIQDQSGDDSPDAVPPKRTLTPDDPSKYHISFQQEGALVENQLYWDSTTQKILQESDVMGRLREGDAFKGREKTPEQFQQQIRQIKGRIREYKQKIQADPGDEQAVKKLKDLYMLKATVDALKETAVQAK